MSEIQTIKVKILDKEYQVSSPPDQIEALKASAAHLDEQMRKIRGSGKVVGLERIAVMAALNISYELLQKKETAAAKAGAVTGAQAKKLNQKLDKALNKLKQMEI